MKRRFLLGAILAVPIAFFPALADDQRFVLATTTSTENSGLLDSIIPLFEQETGIKIDVVAIGTGQALAMGRRGDAAALLTHDRAGEDKFVAEGFGADRRDVMYNDFIIIGPNSDPAKLKEAGTIVQALRKISKTEALFVSRGDDSGTHRKELRLWADAGINPGPQSAWYREAGSGMGQTIITATQMNAYTMSDRATWVKFAQKADYTISYEGDPPLNNPYSSILVTNDVIPKTEADAARKWHDWLTGAQGKNAINAFGVNGQQLFFAN